MYLVVCAGAAVLGQNAVRYESPFAAACCAGAESSGGLAQKDVSRANVRGRLLHLRCDVQRARHNNVPRADRCCRVLCQRFGVRRTHRKDVPSADMIRCSVLCLPCGDWQALYTDMPRADTRCSMLLLRCSAWQLGSVGILLGYMPPSAVAGMRFSHPFS